MRQSQDLSGDVYITLKKQQPLTLQELAALVQATPEAVRLALADLGADGIRVWADSQGKLSISTKTFPDFTAPAESLSADSTAAAAAPDSTAPIAKPIAVYQLRAGRRSRYRRTRHGRAAGSQRRRWRGRGYDTCRWHGHGSHVSCRCGCGQHCRRHEQRCCGRPRCPL